MFIDIIVIILAVQLGFTQLPQNGNDSEHLVTDEHWGSTQYESHDDWLHSSETNYLSDSSDSNMQWESAKFLLRVTEEHKLTHNGVDNLCDSIQGLWIGFLITVQ